MLLWVARPDPLHYPVRCHECQKEGADALCRHCGLPFCGQHRVGSGSLSEGYECMQCWGSDDPQFHAKAKDIHRRTGRLANMLIGVGMVCMGLATGGALMYVLAYVMRLP